MMIECKRMEDIEIAAMELFEKEDYIDPFNFRELIMCHYSKIKKLMGYHDRIVYWNKKLIKFA
jgi:hypothetical protein